MTTLAQEHDCLLLDLDGKVFTGHEATTGAVETLATLTARILYVTNNASRRPAEVAKHLQAMGFTAESDDVVTSAQSAARLLAAQIAFWRCGSHRWHRSVGRRSQSGGSQTGPAMVGCPRRGGAGTFAADRLAGSG